MLPLVPKCDAHDRLSSVLFLNAIWTRNHTVDLHQLFTLDTTPVDRLYTWVREPVSGGISS